MPKIEILQFGPYPEVDQAALDAAYHMRRLHEAGDKPAFVAQACGQVRGIAASGGSTILAEMIAALPALEIISVFGVGYDGIDLDACRARGIRVANTPAVLTGDVADFAVAMALAQTRALVAAEAWARSGDWAAKGAYPLTGRLWGKRAGILGLGRIGFAIARRLAAFDMRIAYTSRSSKPTPEDWTYLADPVALAEQSDYLFVALAASAETRAMVDARVIAALGPDGMLVNISRASNIDETALLDALETGRLGAAALDVFEGEPRVNPRFARLPNVLMQPHHGSATVETRRAMGQLMRDNLEAHFAGRPLLTPVA